MLFQLSLESFRNLMKGDGFRKKITVMGYLIKVVWKS